jgi:hypothetical protein
LDDLRVQHILLAETKSRKLKMGNVPWSPELQVSINRIRYLRACISRFQHHKINSGSLQKLFQKTNLKQKINTYEETTRALSDEYKIYTGIKFKELADVKASEGNQKSASILKQLMTRESQQ